MEDAKDSIEENEVAARSGAGAVPKGAAVMPAGDEAGTAAEAPIPAEAKGASHAEKLDEDASGGAESDAGDIAEDGSKKGGCLAQATKYFGVSFTQTFVEFGVFAALHGLGMNASIANVFAIACSGSYNFIMNRNITFKSSSNLTRSIILFILLYCWNLLFSSTCLAILPEAFGWNTTLVKLLTMCCQGVWGFLLSRYVIFR